MALGIRTLEQRVISGNDFNGKVPTTELVLADSLESYPEDTQGGLFDLGLIEPVFVRSIELKMGGQSLWTINKRDRNGSEVLVFCGDDETDFVTTVRDAFILTAKQLLVVRTTGATAALLCRVSIQASV